MYLILYLTELNTLTNKKQLMQIKFHHKINCIYDINIGETHGVVSFTLLIYST